MAHLNPDFAELQNLIASADQLYTADLASLNNSGISGTVFAIRNGDELTITVIAEGTAPGQAHAQHIHGLFDANGAPVDSQTPSIFADADSDGFIEVLEGVPSYGDIILPLVAPSTTGDFPVSDASGDLFFSYTYDLNNSDAFFSDVTGNNYEGEDLTPLNLREFVMHGLNIPDGYGEGTSGEVNGEGGYIPILPGASGEFSEATAEEASQLLASYQDDFRNVVTAEADAGENLVGESGQDNFILGGGGGDRLVGRDGGDALTGGAGDDRLIGNGGDDFILGAEGNDRAFGGAGEDTFVLKGSVVEYSITDLGDGETAVVNINTGERDFLSDFEAVEFYDATVDIQQPDSTPAPIASAEGMGLIALPPASEPIDDALAG